MAAIVTSHKPRSWRVTVTNAIDEKIENNIPRPCMVCAVFVILTGISVPLLMAAHVLPVSFGLALIAFALAISGTVFALIRCGEL